MTRPTNYRLEPLWRPYAQISRAVLPEPFRSWLLDPTSLTRRLQEACTGRFRVQVVSQAWGRPMPNEARVLGIGRNRYGLIRQVYLLCDERPWVFARTVIPRSTLSGAQRRLAHLKTRPLGAVLFADPTMERDPLEIACLTTNDRLYPIVTQRAPSRDQAVWGRRCVFRLGGKPLLVSEIFLTQIPAHP